MFWTGVLTGILVWFGLCAAATLLFIVFGGRGQRRRDVVHCCVCEQELDRHEWTCPIVENDRFRTALWFYASAGTKDDGARAREALTGDVPSLSG